MIEYTCKTAVALIFFNRPDTLDEVFQKVRKVRPAQLFLIQDGARNGRPDDKKAVQACREVVDNINWDCEVYKNYSEDNLGCGSRVSSGLTWAFEKVDKLIILEDDCVPELSFFPYCERLLDKYENDDRIAMISGLNHNGEWNCGQYSYFFTKTGSIWGWATWRRAWTHFDFNVELLEDSRVEKLLSSSFDNKHAAKHMIKTWKSVRDKVSSNSKPSYWGAQWEFTKYVQESLAIVPKYNLISNVGIGKSTTHGTAILKSVPKPIRKYFFMRTRPIETPLCEPDFVLRDKNYDIKYYNSTYPHPVINFLRRVKGFVIRKYYSIIIKN